MTTQIIHELMSDNDFSLIKNEAEFLELYPKPETGQYRPQPQENPEQYPCYMKEIAIVDNPNGADTAYLSFVYIV